MAHDPLHPFRLVELESGSGRFDLLLTAGDTAVEDEIEALGHLGNGYFWQGVAERLAAEAPALAKALERIELDPEAGMFAAFSKDRAALDLLGCKMAEIANSPDKLRSLVARAEAAGFEFDD
jgi:hypothetical protein